MSVWLVFFVSGELLRHWGHNVSGEVQCIYVIWCGNDGVWYDLWCGVVVGYRMTGR